jgi:hypothetical protein
MISATTQPKSFFGTTTVWEHAATVRAEWQQLSCKRIAGPETQQN